MIIDLSPLECWCLSRSLNGEPIEKIYLRQVAEPVANLITYLKDVNINDRLLVMKTRIPPDYVEEVSSINPRTPPPTAGTQNWTIMPASELKNLPRVEWLVEGQIPKGGLIVIFGRSGSGKSFVALDYALKQAQTRNVVYIAAEGEWGYEQRINAWCKHHNRSEGNLYMCLGAVNLREPLDYNNFLHQVSVIEPELVIVDTLAMSMAGGDENSAKDMTQVILACKTIQKRFNTAVMIVHHVNKGGVAERGSNALRGASDIMMKVEEDNEVIKVESSKTKDVKPFDPMYYRLRPIDESAVLVPSELVVSSEFSLSRAEEQIVEALLMDSLEEATASELMEITSIPKTSVYRATSNLMKFNLVEKYGGRFKLTDKAKNRFSQIPTSPTQNSSQDTFGTDGKSGKMGIEGRDQMELVGIPTHSAQTHYDYE
jgi:adenosyl cobinamide kinase/adenosyl cobinamide phosphate guanylyltransferase